MSTNTSELKRVVNKFVEQIQPKFSELTTYQIALIIFLLFVFRPELRNNALISVQNEWKNENILFLTILMVLAGGFSLSVLHVFTRRKKYTIEKFIIGGFAILLCGYAGLFATLETLPKKFSILLIFPIWNYIWGLLLMNQLAKPQEALTDDEASPLEVIIATISVFLVFIFTNFIFRYSWAMILSIGLFFSSITTLSIGKTIHYISDYFSLKA